ncbi:1-deoxy-D-xylulose 5-phosphate reductoisomerase [Murinocardiopsis flavida]|uniref:1-deoxy-D-xylulose 5-phosphate reductoisomerase n=1 Tax=Murinocardiopsis flavida TaxID=645275 RepID=A0A2P8CW42_9ACTN|nr:1-deoxy-D-xylulose-5-phosphate reductoisomerase [Murinocardiopsis flavida]PSK89167.1 1-deoxy-D-xylulose 5-phosphate reductoisomerase [Murinocardiopsis flavida]
MRIAEQLAAATGTAPRDVVILGSTGSIGTQAVDIVRRNPDRFRVVGLAAGGGRVDLLAEQAAALDVPVVAVADAAQAARLAERLTAHGSGAKVLAGAEAVAELAAHPCDVVLNGVNGALGLESTLAALRAGRLLALANKESLIIGGPLVRDLAEPGQIVPVDSEHFALAQCFPRVPAAELTSLAQGHVDARPQEVARLVVTASGGPFRGRSRAELDRVTPAEALAHPTWAMGPVITVNSATLVNKGLEVIEAHLLFDVGFDRIEVVVHPQSIIHSMVEYADGSTLAQASPPDMRIPIAYGLSWPERVSGAAAAVDWTAAQTWTFEPLDGAAFPAVGLACEVGAAGGTAPAVYNAANEEAVAAFLAGTLAFPAIVDTVARVVSEHQPAAGHSLTLDEVYAADGWARRRARELISATV